MMEQTIGSILRQKREQKKLSIEQVFQAIKIRPVYLQAIEDDHIDQLPSRAQARGFIRLYASFLDLDPYELLETAASPVEPEPVPEEQSSVQPTVKSAKKQPPIEKTTKQPPVEEAPGNLSDLVQKVPLRIGKQISSGKKQVKDTMSRLVDKIPYRIVRKDKSEVSPVNAEPSKQHRIESKTQAPAENGKYRAMSRAIGEDLRKARETLGLSIADVERQIRIREFYLFSMEQGNFDDLPSTVQGRGMLSNYATFLNLNAEDFLSRFAEVLQQRRLETMPEAQSGVPIPERSNKAPITGWKRLLSADLIFTGSIFLVFFVFIVWGVFQLMGAGSNSANATVVPISDLLLSSGTPTVGENVTVETVAPTSMIGNLNLFTPVASVQGTQTFSTSDPIQLSIAANKRAFLQITVDGKTAFLGRTIPGTVYNFSGKSKINLVCGDASAIQIYYNQNYMGVLGIVGQVVMMDFTPSKAIDLTANYTATPTVTQIATLTPNPTATPTVTILVPTETATPSFIESTPTP